MTEGLAPRLALVTAAVARPVDDDLEPLIDALTSFDVSVDLVDWDDATVDWSSFDATVIRSTWDYSARLDEFLSVIDRISASTRLWNPAPIVRWNTDKRYLHDLAASGVAVVPSDFTEPGDLVEFPMHGEYVVKPSVSAGSRDTARFGPGDEHAARQLVDHIWQSGRTAMVQPYQSAVDHEGELALLWFGGEFSHAIRKGPLLTRGAEPTRALFAEEHIVAAEPTAAHLDLAAIAVGAVTDRFDAVLGSGPPGSSVLPYARVDIVATADGLAVLELELIEPSVFLATAPSSAERFAASLLAGLARPASNDGADRA